MPGLFSLKNFRYKAQTILCGAAIRRVIYRPNGSAGLPCSRNSDPMLTALYSLPHRIPVQARRKAIPNNPYPQEESYQNHLPGRSHCIRLAPVRRSPRLKQIAVSLWLEYERFFDVSDADTTRETDVDLISAGAVLSSDI